MNEQSLHIERTFFTALGALEHVNLSFFDRSKWEHVEIANLESTQELVSCTGMVTVRDGQPTAHIHAVVVDKEGTTRGGTY